ncbi:hypothetical protein [Roseburia inulinivorans]|nr:hypothetical protein [Roseburia inulinivorans]
MLIQAADQFNVLSILVVNLCSEVFTERMGGYADVGVRNAER